MKEGNNIKYDKNKTYVANLTFHYKRMLSDSSVVLEPNLDSH